jgi:ABC-type transport system substrate-binding protein
MELTESMKRKHVRMESAVYPSIAYYAFNMLDDVVGGYAPERKKLRQAISIAIDNEEFIELFRNGRDSPAVGPVPPGIFGYDPSIVNPFVYDGRCRKSVEEARRLLAEAGYPRGLVINFDTAMSATVDKSFLDWLAKQFAKIGVELRVRSTDYNRFREKLRKGDYQMCAMGWGADCPDPENILFLLYGPNGAAKFGGPNHANYDRAEYNRLFEKMRSMEDTPERLELIQRMVRMVQEDAPWVYELHGVSFSLFHEWITNTKALTFGAPEMKYRRIDGRLRAARRAEWNRAVAWPLPIMAAFLLLACIPAFRFVRERERRSARL